MKEADKRLLSELFFMCVNFGKSRSPVAKVWEKVLGYKGEKENFFPIMEMETFYACWFYEAIHFSKLIELCSFIKTNFPYVNDTLKI